MLESSGQENPRKLECEAKVELSCSNELKVAWAGKQVPEVKPANKRDRLLSKRETERSQPRAQVQAPEGGPAGGGPRPAFILFCFLSLRGSHRGSEPRHSYALLPFSWRTAEGGRSCPETTSWCRCRALQPLSSALHASDGARAHCPRRRGRSRSPALRSRPWLELLPSSTPEIRSHTADQPSSRSERAIACVHLLSHPLGFFSFATLCERYVFLLHPYHSMLLLRYTFLSFFIDGSCFSRGSLHYHPVS
jgi:hypothetical protein